MKLPLYWVDAFTRSRFHGNPAAVVVSETPLAPELMQRIAAENNIAETAFVVPAAKGYSIRWFTPMVEVDLCGHATLASAFALGLHGHVMGTCFEFSSASGPLTVARDGARLALDFPARLAKPSTLAQEVSEALGATPSEVLQAAAMMAVFKTEEELRALRPKMDAVMRLPGYGLVATAPGNDCDFVSRFFAPKVGVPEDPVTGSTHCTLTPYWSARLGKAKLYAKQLSARGGELWCADRNERVTIAGHCALYMRGEIEA
jgi:PhzF family phenazine biosynthesis protein